MGKNHRHKKNLKADKAKVKLKQSKTKFLPKGLNETKATFKVKPIVLAEQLREKSTDIPLSRRKLNIQDLCNRMNHYNENTRASACEELAEMLKHFSGEIIKDNLFLVVKNVGKLMQDKERKVRNAAVKIITLILELTPNEKLEPYFIHFSVNMRCAMTHIDKNIQEDSLKFLDCFIIKDCGLITKVADKLLPDFFTLISRLTYENNLGRTLTVNLGSKMTSVTWRIKVLSRLHAILDLVLKNDQSNKDHVVYTSVEGHNCLPIYKTSFFQVLNNPDWYISEDDRSSSLDKHLSTLIPIFYQIWMEILPQQKTQVNEITSLNDEASAILGSIVNTTYLLWQYIEKTHGVHSNVKNIFMTVEATKFLTHLLGNFPYTRTDNLKIKNRNTSALSLSVNTDVNCVKENIILCYIYFVLNANFTRNTVNTELDCISLYINRCLLTKNYINQNNIEYVIEFLRISLVEKCHVWEKSKIDARQILENVMIFYNSNSTNEKNKVKLFKIFSELLDNPYLSKSTYYQSWLVSLPGLLCKPQITDFIIEILLELARKNSFDFLAEIKVNMTRIMQNINDLNIIMTTRTYKDAIMMKRDIAFIFYYVQEFSCLELIEIFENFHSYMSRGDCSIFIEKHHKCKDKDCIVIINY